MLRLEHERARRPSVPPERDSVAAGADSQRQRAAPDKRLAICRPLPLDTALRCLHREHALSRRPARRVKPATAVLQACPSPASQRHRARAGERTGRRRAASPSAPPARARPTPPHTVRRGPAPRFERPERVEGQERPYSVTAQALSDPCGPSLAPDRVGSPASPTVTARMDCTRGDCGCREARPAQTW